MTISQELPKLTELRPRLTVVGVGGAGSNAVNNMISSGLSGVTFVVANTDAQSLANSTAEHRIQLGVTLTEGLGAGAKPEIGEAAALEAADDIRAQLTGSHMVFIAAGMGGGTGTGAAAVIAKIAREVGALTVGVVTKPFQFEGSRRMRAAEAGIAALKPNVDTMIVIPNQNLFRIANEKTTFSEAFILADQVLFAGIACIVDLIIKDGLINLDFADVRAIMAGMGTAVMGTGEASGERRAERAAEDAISNPLLDDVSLMGAKGLLVSITGGRDMTLYEVDEAASRVRQEVDPDANIIVGATFDEGVGDRIRVSIVASGMERSEQPFTQALSGALQGSAAPSRQSRSNDVPQPDHPAGPASAAAQGGRDPSASHPSQAPAGAHGQPQQDERDTSWTSDSGAVFQDGPPVISLPTDQVPTVEPLFEPLAPPARDPDFRPQPPVEPRRGHRRLPDVGDFPAVGQREYRAKMEQYDGRSVPRAYAARPPAEPPRKLGFLQRLAGVGRKQTQPEDYDQGERLQQRSGPRAAEPQRRRTDAAGDRRQYDSDQSEQPEMPVFYGNETKR
ncbi:MAG: cell division protein FtsZ [Hyphomicrobiaceae bacterium]